MMTNTIQDILGILYKDGNEKINKTSKFNNLTQWFSLKSIKYKSKETLSFTRKKNIFSNTNSSKILQKEYSGEKLQKEKGNKLETEISKLNLFEEDKE